MAGRRGALAGAWAAAATVLAVGALALGIAEHRRLGATEDRLRALERRSPSSVVVVDSVPGTTGRPSTSARPPDEDLARSQIEFAFGVVYDASVPDVDRIKMIDDGSGVDDALRQLATTSTDPTVRELHVRVDRVEFTSASRASVEYRLVGRDDEAHQGTARVVDGAWKVTRASFCADLAAFGSPCRR